MIRFILVIFFLFPPTQSFAQGFSFCGEKALKLDFISEDNYEGEPNIAEVKGKIEVPHPGYMYSMVFKPMDSQGLLHGVLTLGVREKTKLAQQRISKLFLHQGLEVPNGASEILIEVIKPYNWGASYYKGKLNRTETVCLLPIEEEYED